MKYHLQEISEVEVHVAFSIDIIDDSTPLAQTLSKIPSDSQWFQFDGDDTVLEACYHVYHESWDTLSSGTGRLEVTAKNIIEERESLPETLTEQINKITTIADTFNPALCNTLILGANNPQDGPFILIDGNHRASALTLRRHKLSEATSVPLTFFLAVAKNPIWRWS